jgi:uncharacterized membrane protein
MEPVDDPLNYRWGIFYFNKNDSRIIVPKRARSFGWTLNFARGISYVIILAIIGSVVAAIILE